MGKFIKWLRKLFGSGNNSIPLPLVSDDVEQIKKKLLELHNQYRIAQGLFVFKRVIELDRAAQLHNDYMVQIDNLTHNGENGRNIGKRVNEHDYQWISVGENIAWGQNTPEEVMNSWMNSSGHRANILSREYEDIGFGVTKSGNTWWWTVNFGKR